ncbi:nuclear transport factor 2 family protein [Antarcticibacterium arcticum]|uniref:Nuclear transport factor 2 family protein n=1 Tax=Antarcticibacterium arcticum TaxID=2585771 RepID=A0A5B8YIM7_9FLAO|nr:nuclear transport factor 2 family protein [Antarcticibacterium arcticum]QED36473.1 nuclear transport factor 2 family protein [Antarcticibacterium arcticum]
MKHLQIFILLLLSTSGFAQNQPEDDKVKKVVTDFFEAFHQQDSLALRELAHPNVIMQSVSTNPAGETKVVTVDYGNFLKSIVSIPASTKFEEKLHSFDVTMNGSLATIVTPFSFYLNGNLSHCGVNSFTMVKEAEEWKIVHIIDTRIKEGCKE